MLNDMYKLLASVAVVRELYDANKSIYDVIQEFIYEIIARRRLYSFTADAMTNYLNADYSFKLSESIIRTCLRRIGLERNGGEYKCADINFSNSEFSHQFIESENNNELLFCQLKEFLEKRLTKKITSQEEESIKRAFCDFLLQDSLDGSSSYTQFFNEFVLSIEDNPSMMEVLQNIKQGTLIYEGIRYSSNINEVGSWTSKITLVLDTEILFSIGGYNSSLLQSMYSELDMYLKEINRGCGVNAPKISLAYFPETKNELDIYFDSAERIVRGLDNLDPTKEAMGQIVNNCKTPSDIQTKKSLFFQCLREHGVKLLDVDFYTQENKNNTLYNIENAEIIDKYSKKWNEKPDNIHRSLVHLSHVNILRKGSSNNGFENCGFVFLTATGRTLKLSCVQELLEEGNVPLATSLDFLINRFWFKLNKGFGANRTPRTMDMVMRARHVLASIINLKASEKYDEFKGQYERDEITKEQFCILNNELRSKLKTPKEVDKDTIGEAISDLDRWKMEEILEAEKKKEAELINARNEIATLELKLDESNKTQEDLRNALMETKQQFDDYTKDYEAQKKQWNEKIIVEKEKNETNEKDIEELKKQLKQEQEARKTRERKEKLRKYHIMCVGIGILVLAGVIVYVYGSIKGWKWTIAVSALIEISAVVMVIIAQVKKLKPKKET